MCIGNLNCTTRNLTLNSHQTQEIYTLLLKLTSSVYIQTNVFIFSLSVCPLQSIYKLLPPACNDFWFTTKVLY